MVVCGSFFLLCLSQVFCLIGQTFLKVHELGDKKQKDVWNEYLEWPNCSNYFYVRVLRENVPEVKRERRLDPRRAMIDMLRG